MRSAALATAWGLLRRQRGAAEHVPTAVRRACLAVGEKSAQGRQAEVVVLLS
jgi:hypothetical protein